MFCGFEVDMKINEINITSKTKNLHVLKKGWTLAFLVISNNMKQDYCQARSQDLNQPLQDIAQNFDDDDIIMVLVSLSWHRGKTWKILRKNMNNLVNHATYRWTVWSIGICCTTYFNLQKNSKINVYSLNSVLCAPIARAAIKQLLLGVW